MFHQQGSAIFDALTCSSADAASTAADNARSPSLKQNSSAQAALEVRSFSNPFLLLLSFFLLLDSF